MGKRGEKEEGGGGDSALLDSLCITRQLTLIHSQGCIVKIFFYGQDTSRDVTSNTVSLFPILYAGGQLRLNQLGRQT